MSCCKTCFRGVTGFDGLYVEIARRSACSTATLILSSTKLAKNTFASVMSPYFGAADFAFVYA